MLKILHLPMLPNSYLLTMALWVTLWPSRCEGV